MRTLDEIVFADRVQMNEAFRTKSSPFLQKILKQAEEEGYFTAGVMEGPRRSAPFELIMHIQTSVDDNRIFHNHNCFELAYVYRGTCRNLRPGYEVTLKEGDLLLMNPMAVHCMCTGSDSDVVFNFLIPTEIVEQDFQSMQSDNPISDFFLDYLHNMHTGPDFLIISGERNEALDYLIQHLIVEYHEKLPGCDIILQTGLLQIFILMARRLSHSLDALPLKDTSDLVRNLILYISKNIATVTLSELSKEFSYNKKHISRQLKKELGMGFTEFLQQQRLRNATELLSHTSMSVAQISREVGYNNVHFFYDLFQAQYGDTPAAWRAANHKVSNKQ